MYKARTKHHGGRQDEMIYLFCIELDKFSQRKFQLKWTTENQVGLSRQREFLENGNP